MTERNAFQQLLCTCVFITLKTDFITLLLITFHWLIETMLDHVTVVFSYAMAVVLNLKSQYVDIYSGFTC